VPVAVGVCAPWVAPGDVECFDDLALDSGQATTIALFASDVLYALSGRHWPGVCDRTVRPDLGAGTVWWCESPGRWSSLTGRWGRGEGREMRIPGPVHTVTEIVIDGAILAESAYVQQGANAVIRVDGSTWPTGQDLSRDPDTVPASPLPAGTPPAWEVRYEWGAAPPPSGETAFKSLACEIAAAALGKPCKLPWAGAAATVVRRGVSVNYQSVADKLATGKVGLADVDLWLTAARGGPWRPWKPRIGRADAGRSTVSAWPEPVEL
jgi:hypothetical protein